MKLGKLDEFKTQISDMVDMGTLVPLNEEEIENLKIKPLYYNKLSFIQSANSGSTSLRVLRDSTSKVANVGGMISVIAQIQQGVDIGDGLTSVIQHGLNTYAASLDISKAYHQIKISYRDSLLWLSIWYKNPEMMKDLIIFRTCGEI